MGGGAGCSAQTDVLGDGCTALNAILNYVTGISIDSKRHMFIADFGNNRIRDVLLPKVGTTLVLQSSQNPSPSGQAVTFTAKVSWPGGAAPDGEIVKFVSGNTVYGSIPLKNGLASVVISGLPVGTTTVQAIYSGDTNLWGSRGSLLQGVNP